MSNIMDIDPDIFERPGMIEELLFNTSAQKILRFLLSNPDVKFYDREISRLSGVKKSSANYALRSLVREKVVYSEKRGRIIFYCAETSDPLTRMLKTALNTVLVRPLTDSLRDEADKIIMYGPAAKGLNPAGGDIDICITGEDIPAIEKIITQSTADDAIACLIKTPLEYSGMEKDNPDLFDEICRGFKIL